jgi:hypothetical protein
VGAEWEALSQTLRLISGAIELVITLLRQQGGQMTDVKTALDNANAALGRLESALQLESLRVKVLLKQNVDLKAQLGDIASKSEEATAQAIQAVADRVVTDAAAIEADAAALDPQVDAQTTASEPVPATSDESAPQ